MPGKLIVIEGTDGSGKSTQFARLCQRLDEESLPFHRLIFPRYDQPSSALLRMYLAGEFGTSPSDVNAYAASAFYAVDRYASWKQAWGEDYRAGGLVLSDRYTTSNAVHQASKLPREEWEPFFEWLFDFECGKLGLPYPGLVLYLDMPPEQAAGLLRGREHARNTRGDIHEQDGAYLALCRETALAAADYFGWGRVPCVDGEGAVRPVEEIHGEIWSLVQKYLETV